LTEVTVPKLATLKVALSTLDKTCAKLKRNNQQNKLQLLMDESMEWLILQHLCTLLQWEAKSLF